MLPRPWRTQERGSTGASGISATLWGAKSQDASGEVPREAGWVGQGASRSHQGRPAIVFVCVLDGTSDVDYPVGFCKFSGFFWCFFGVFWTALYENSLSTNRVRQCT